MVEQFYAWERRGRGWYKADSAADLEPPFEPFRGHFIEHDEIIDDGRTPSFFATIAELVAPKPPLPPKKSELPILQAYPFQDESPLSLFVVHFPRAAKPTMSRMEQLLVMLSYKNLPMSFEVIGTAEAIVVQVTSREGDANFLFSQCKAFFPDCIITEPDEDLLVEALDTDRALSVVDFGLAEEFMLPLLTHATDPDPYLSLFGLVDHLQRDETIALQILFNGTVNAWAESTLLAVCDDSGRQSFFLDAPEMPQLAKQKLSAPLCAVSVRLVTLAPQSDRASELLQYAAIAIMQATKSAHNSLLPLSDTVYTAIERVVDIAFRRSHRVGMLLNTAELSALAHFPTVSNAKLHYHTRTTKAAPGWYIGDEYVIGVNVHQGSTALASLSRETRLRHLHILGATGTGKSTLLHSLILQDIYSGTGCCVLDPHGDLIDNVLNHIPASRIDDVLLIDPTDPDFVIPFNILSAHSDSEREMLASDLVGLFKRFSTSWGDQMHSVLANAILTLLYNTKPWHVGDLKRFLIETAFRKTVLDSVTDPDLMYYWLHQFPLLKGGSIGPLVTRLDSFLRPKSIRNMLCQTKSIDVAGCMDSSKIILVKLPQGLIGLDNSYLLGALIVSKLQQCAMARQAQASTSREPFFIYIDEFPHFITPSMALILSGARKYGVGLVLAHQDMQQVVHADADLAASLMANAGTRICFRLGDTDAKRFQEGFSGFNAEDFQRLAVGEAIARVGGMDTDFSVSVYPFSQEALPNLAEAIRAHSQKQFGIAIQLHENAEILEPVRPTTVALAVSNSEIAEEPSKDVETGGQVREHRYTQTFIKKMAEEYGYIATLEYPTTDGKGFIDLVLQKEEKKIAIEITVSTDPAWEVHNIEKCLSDGFDDIVVCCTDAKKLTRIQDMVKKNLAPDICGCVRYINPQDIAAIVAPTHVSAPAETVMKGYRVKVQYEPGGVDKQALLKRIAAGGKKSS
ncbi:type IV secretion system DNA-binding domain-containing protein [Mucilaginibacter ginsenosidivorans]|uniref:type IV secretion system DNA-binding domain-containing protein n=1 Tax=Mucilaginibacter ginsenosidivorans TaxID=398053 RepID=UPI00165246BF|nr:type IV secretion system DNA-binding domain-containing protein [Mucilaginibacter ginsenosidivorans]